MMMAAGTGGHVFPALAVAKYLQQQGTQVSWLATFHGMENRLLNGSGIHLHQINIHGVRGNGLLATLKAPFKILAATISAMRYMKQHKVNAVAGFGGYVAGPGGLAARILGIPILIHEQNAVAGMTNTQLARIAQTVCEAFPNTFAASGKIKTTGNPVRAEIAALAAPRVRYAERAQQQLPLRILIVGGSLGAQALNSALPPVFVRLAQHQPLHVTHQCGQQQLPATQARYDHAPQQLEVSVQAFIQDMAAAYAAADIIICRAGALTVTEVATAGVAAIFIPLPSAVDDHQTANAQFLAQSGAARICPQADLSELKLLALLQPLLHRERLMQMAELAYQHAQPDATQQVAHLIQALSGE